MSKLRVATALFTLLLVSGSMPAQAHAGMHCPARANNPHKSGVRHPITGLKPETLNDVAAKGEYLCAGTTGALADGADMMLYLWFCHEEPIGSEDYWNTEGCAQVETDSEPFIPVERRDYVKTIIHTNGLTGWYALCIVMYEYHGDDVYRFQRVSQFVWLEFPPPCPIGPCAPSPEASVQE